MPVIFSKHSIPQYLWQQNIKMRKKLSYSCFFSSQFLKERHRQFKPGSTLLSAWLHAGVFGCALDYCFLLIHERQARKHASESKLHLRFSFCVNKPTILPLWSGRKAVKPGLLEPWAVRGASLHPATAPSLQLPAAWAAPHIHSWMRQRVLFAFLLFYWAEGWHSHPKSIFPGFSLQNQFLILCTINHEIPHGSPCFAVKNRQLRWPLETGYLNEYC